MFVYPKQYDIIVVGAGHAGVEAALASARMGAQTLLLTINIDSLAQMSCNPAVGGLAKGHLAREIDALGGEMGRNTDLTGLQFRMLNTKKGPSVWAPRAQCDKKAYQFRLKWVCERQENLDLKQGQACGILRSGDEVCGVDTTLGIKYMGRAVILTTGTFLRGLMHIGLTQSQGGRAGEAAALGLSESLIDAGLELGRLKTGTPPRIARKSIDFSKCEIQHGDEPVPYFSYWKDDFWKSGAGGVDVQREHEMFHVEQSKSDMADQQMFHVEHSARQSSNRATSPYPPGSILEQNGGQLPCYITYTTDATGEVIRANLDKSPLYSGVIEGVGPRYCPSIEDKIIKFPDKKRQQLFLEPEGIATDEFYINGFSTSLPFEVQVQMVRTIIGCEHAEIMRPAYAIEYDFAFPTQLYPTLETKVCRNLFLAGQINGTSGYEEAAAQGLMAGINAVRKLRREPPVVLRRNEAYIGVLIDDLVTKGAIEPYRMFTSRAEYRLLLRQDNADLRLCDLGYSVGLLPARNHQAFVAKRAAIEAELARLETTRSGPDTLAQLLRRPEVSYADLPDRNPCLTNEVIQQVEIALKYQGYIARQEVEVAKLKSLEDKQIPAGLDYSRVPSLRTEARQKLAKIRPATLGQASRISGVSPSDVSILMVWLKSGPCSE